MEDKGNSKKSSFWQRFNNSKKTDNFLKAGKYFWFFVGICFIIDLIIRPIVGGNDSSFVAVLSSLFMGFFASLGYSILFLAFGLKRKHFKQSVVEGGVGCSTILLLMFTATGIVMLIFG
mgnify:CR=1 FL=1|tara:strand:- start:334 stop:690 length:357 start_codon:yes stop_codon:yes gene_type:complete